MDLDHADKEFMRMALELAARGRGLVSPNPMVGAVVVKDGRVLGQGYHKEAGGRHAEVYALAEAKGETEGATVYVNLEPCCHFGRNPPCTNQLIAAGITRVVVAVTDPNPRVSGAGLRELEENGIEVTTGVLAEEARRLNEVFFKYITTGLPFVSIKAAVSLDGKIATRTGNSRWISGEESRRRGHELRRAADAIVVGVGTVIKDDPLLNVRLPVLQDKAKTKHPLRLILDTRARIPLTAKVIKENPEQTVIVTGSDPPAHKVEKLTAAGVRIWTLPLRRGRVSLPALLAKAGEERLSSLLVEGGGEVNAAFLGENLVDKVYLFLAPRIIGGASAPTWVEGEGVDQVVKGSHWRNAGLTELGNDLLLEYYPEEEGADVYRDRS
ncbi:MAG TPA: bifunctional diaminohydroxyphosphoribosylaminopyrimidine deaminase/5-amino-6-(5-phosphoribosylamino)uracil reductase RibD [Hydrogenispora sp.]|nr:bifunctional diaminohydroxyphosphoribosylaminopyrimidine deaminase/5-amino-6-(5-phosphoribosylamino)uracil reductase RibD [Hydrogenispora sp.]